MERTVPKTASEEIELYLRTIYSLLRTTTEIQIRTLEETHAGMNSSLHPHAREIQPDMSAFIYSLLRLPACILHVKTIVLGQSANVFSQHGYKNIEKWQQVSASARRRRCYFDGQETLACYIASRTDIDDIIPVLTAYQIEWNKLHLLLQKLPPELLNTTIIEYDKTLPILAETLMIPLEDLNRLTTIWGDAFLKNLKLVAKKENTFMVRLLNGSFSEYRRSTHSWWSNIELAYPDLAERPVYFISSNNHSIKNQLSGFALQHRQELQGFLEKGNNPDLLAEWLNIQNCDTPSNQENFLYYILKKYQQTPEGRHLLRKQQEIEEKCAIVNIPGEHSFDVEAQVIKLSCLDIQRMDPRLNKDDLSFLEKSDALILNIDYPLGLSAYNILGTISEHVGQVQGIYLMGKAATLNGVIGDVMIPSVVHDEHSQNTYLFQNAFSASNVSPYLVYGTVLDNQKAFTVLG